MRGLFFTPMVVVKQSGSVPLWETNDVALGHAWNISRCSMLVVLTLNTLDRSLRDRYDDLAQVDVLGPNRLQRISNRAQLDFERALPRHLEQPA